MNEEFFVELDYHAVEEAQEEANVHDQVDDEEGSRKVVAELPKRVQNPEVELPECCVKQDRVGLGQ